MMLPTKCRFIWPSVSEEKIVFRNQPIKNKNCLWRPCLLTDRDEMINLFREPIYAFYQVSVHLAKQFQRKRFCLNINQSETRIARGGHFC